MRIVKIDFDYLKNYPNIFVALYKCFEEKPFVLYGVQNGDKLDLISRSENTVFYIENDGVINASNFEIDQDYNVMSFAHGNVEYSLNGGVLLAARKDGFEESLTLANDCDENEPFLGQVVYTQYDPKRDIKCELRYDHRSVEREEKRERIYDCKIGSIDYVCISKDFKKKTFKWGFLGGRNKYYAGFTVKNDSYDYDLISIKEYGLLDYLHKGSMSLLGTSTAKRFTKGWFVSKNGSYRCYWPFGMIYKEEDVRQLVEDYSFSSTIPSDLLQTYNGENEFLNRVSAVLEELRVLEKDYNKVEEMALLMKLHN